MSVGNLVKRYNNDTGELNQTGILQLKLPKSNLNTLEVTISQSIGLRNLLLSFQQILELLLLKR